MRSSPASRIAIYALLTLFAVIAIFPLWWIVATSLETTTRAYSFPGAFLPQGTLANFSSAWHMSPWAGFLGNSLLIGALTTAGSTTTSLLCAYGLVFVVSKRYARVAFAVVVATMLVPFYAVIIPDFVIVRDLGWLDTYTAQIVPFLASGFAIFLFRQFLRSFPTELRDAARADGVGNWGFLWRIVLPNIKAAIATVSIYTFILSWNAFLWPLIVTSSSRVQPVQVGLADLLSTANGTDWTLVSAAAAITAAPIVVIYLFAQRQVVDSVVRTGIR
ncbi:MAG: carbohydrate ABC transporter permease [Acidimicrobiales bacterium]